MNFDLNKSEFLFLLECEICLKKALEYSKTRRSHRFITKLKQETINDPQLMVL